MIVNRYKYYFEFGLSRYEVYPIEDIEISGEKYSKEGVCVAFRKSIEKVIISKNGVLPSRDIFIQDESSVVYEKLVMLWADEMMWSERYYFIVYDTCFEKEEKYIFNVIDCNFNYDYGTVEIEFKNRDAYFIIDEKGDQVINLFDTISYSQRKNVAFDIKPVATGDIEFYTSFGEDNWFYDLSPTYDDFVTIEGTQVKVNAILTSKIKPPFSFGWQFDKSEERWYANPGDYSNGFIFGWDVIAAKIPSVVTNINQWVLNYAKTQGIKIVVRWNNFYNYVIIFGYGFLSHKTVRMDNAVLLSDAMEVVCGELGLTVDAHWAGIFFNVPQQLLMQKSDFKRYEVSNNATKFNVTFNELLAAIRTISNVKWWIEGDTIYFRPIYYVNMNLPKRDYRNFRVDNIFKVEYQDIPYKEKWVFMEQGSFNFNIDTCIYNRSIKSVVEGNEQEYSASKCTVDLYYIIYNIDEISDDGFVLLSCDTVTDGYKIRYYNDYPNGEFSTRNIQDKRFCYNRPLKKYYYDELGSESVIAKSTEPLVQIEIKNIRLEDEDEFNPQKIGVIKVYSEIEKKNIDVDCYVYSYQYNTKTRVLNLIVRAQVIL